jgi:hypothetical protein
MILGGPPRCQTSDAGHKEVFECSVLQIEEAYSSEFEEYGNSIISIYCFGIYQLHIVPKIKGKKSSPGSRVGDKIVP